MHLMLSSNRKLLLVLAAALTAIVCAGFVVVALAGSVLTRDHGFARKTPGLAQGAGIR